MATTGIVFLHFFARGYKTGNTNLNQYAVFIGMLESQVHMTSLTLSIVFNSFFSPSLLLYKKLLTPKKLIISLNIENILSRFLCSSLLNPQVGMSMSSKLNLAGNYLSVPVNELGNNCR